MLEEGFQRRLDAVALKPATYYGPTERVVRGVDRRKIKTLLDLRARLELNAGRLATVCLAGLVG